MKRRSLNIALDFLCMVECLFISAERSLVSFEYVLKSISTSPAPTPPPPNPLIVLI